MAQEVIQASETVGAAAGRDLAADDRIGAAPWAMTATEESAEQVRDSLERDAGTVACRTSQQRIAETEQEAAEQARAALGTVADGAVQQRSDACRRSSRNWCKQGEVHGSRVGGDGGRHSSWKRR